MKQRWLIDADDLISAIRDDPNINGAYFARFKRYIESAKHVDAMDDFIRRNVCPLRHENGNCLPIGGFCTAVNDNICDALHRAYQDGYFNGLRKTEPVRHGLWRILKSDGSDDAFECSECRNISMYGSLYCPYCGVKIQGTYLSDNKQIIPNPNDYIKV